MNSRKSLTLNKSFNRLKLFEVLYNTIPNYSDRYGHQAFLKKKTYLGIPKAQVEIGPHYFVKHAAFNCVTEQVGYGCLTNLLSSSLYMGPQLRGLFYP